MPITIYTSDLAHADVPTGRLTLRYGGEGCLPTYRLVLVDTHGEEIAREGPFDHEDEALARAAARFAAWRWDTP